MAWTLLVLSLPTGNATARMRAWRSLKGCGAAVLRDGVYALPDTPAAAPAFEAIAADVRASGGEVQVLHGASGDPSIEARFDRSADYAALLDEVRAARAARDVRGAQRVRKALERIAAIDYFPGPASRQAHEAVAALEADVATAGSEHEPRALQRLLTGVDRERYRRRVWATRARPWVDRLASGWLIRRHIDPQARFRWIDSPAACPKRAVGFDFDGATFTHSPGRVTFETLLAAFGLETPALLRLGAIVHALDAGGVRPAECDGVERVIAGMHAAIDDDDALLDTAAGVFEALHVAFAAEGPR